MVELCDRCREPIAERAALLPGALELHAVVTVLAGVERKLRPSYCRDCAGLYNFYFAGFLGGLAVVIFVLAVIVWS
jgi:hypothetical protein